MTESAANATIRLVAEFTALPGCEEEVERLLLALAADVQKEEGCLLFIPRHVVEPPPGVDIEPGPAPVQRRFVITEAYRDAAAFAAHLRAPYGAHFNSVVAPLIEEKGSTLTFLADVSE